MFLTILNYFRQILVALIGSHKSKTGRPIEKGKNDKQWSIKQLHRKLKIEQHESHIKPERNSVGDNLSLYFYIVWQFHTLFNIIWYKIIHIIYSFFV
jgi:hypothetical protein